MKNVIKKGFSALIFAMMIILAVPSIMPESSGFGYVEAASVKLNATKTTLIKGQTKTLKVKGTSKKVKWTSNKKSVATVNSKGEVTAKKKGTAKITAKVGGKKYTCKVTVETPKISKESITLTVGGTKMLKISGTSQKITWSSNKTSVAKVSAKGKVTAKKAGTATITAKVGGKKYKCKVTVKKKTVAVTGIKLNKTSSTLAVGNTLTLSAKVTPSNATNQTVKWSSSSASVASVNSSGKVTAKKAGKATITATSGDVKSSCVIKVENPSISKTELSVIAGDSEYLSIEGTYEDVTWKSSNTSVATVDKYGEVTGKKAGSATITATVLGKTFKCKVTVYAEFSEEDAINSITYTTKENESEIFCFIQHDYIYPLEIDGQMLFYNSNGSVIDVEYDGCCQLEPGKTYVFSFRKPKDSHGNYVSYSKYSIEWKAYNVTDYESYQMGHSKLTYKVNQGVDSLIVAVTNNSSEEVYYNMAIVFYKNGQVAWCDPWGTFSLKAGSTQYLQCDYIWDDEADDVMIPDSWEIYLG